MKDKTLPDKEIVKALEECIELKFDDTEYATVRLDTLTNALDLITRQQCEIVKCKCVIQLLKKDVANAKSEAVKEFAERFKNKIKTECNPYGKPTFDYDTSITIMRYIDNLVKEMVGDNNAE